MDLSLTRYYYIEVVFAVSSREVLSATVNIATSFPGYYTAPDKLRFLIGKTDGIRYWPYTISTIYSEGIGSSAAAYTGPFDVTYAGAVAAIGATRGTATRGSDYIIVHPDTLLKASQELVTVTGNGVVYYSIRREDWDMTAVSATPLYAAALPAHATNTMMVPLAQVFFAAGAITGVRQIQYGNILIDKTSADYCP
jgi:hypothetical protein